MYILQMCVDIAVSLPFSQVSPNPRIDRHDLTLMPPNVT